MDTRKARVFLASTFETLKEERRAFNDLCGKYANKFEFLNCERWFPQTSEPAVPSYDSASKADFLFLVLGGSEGTIDAATKKPFVRGEYEEFLYSHTVECANAAKKGDVLFAFIKDPVQGTESWKDFISVVSDKHTPKLYSSVDEFKQEVDKKLNDLPDAVPSRSYKKVSIHQFDFLIHPSRYELHQIKTSWSDCPCQVGASGNCNYTESRQYQPPQQLKDHMMRVLNKRLSLQNIPHRFKTERSSYKTTSIRESSSGLNLEFCRSSWYKFWCTNQAATEDEDIKSILQSSLCHNNYIETSPFSNNLGFTVAVVNENERRLFYILRSKKGVSVHPGTKGAAVGTQLHAYSTEHRNEDGSPNITGALYEELQHEAGIGHNDVKGLYMVGWGIGTRTGTPELLFVCVTRKEKKLSDIVSDIIENIVSHYIEFDRVKMREELGSNSLILSDYRILADILEDSRKPRPQWEPESAVASCFACHYEFSKSCVTFK